MNKPIRVFLGEKRRSYSQCLALTETGKLEPVCDNVSLFEDEW